MLDFDLAELGVDRHHVGLEPPHIALGIGLPRGRMSRPEQPVVADDAVVIVGEVGIGHRAAIGDGLGQARTERRGGDRIAPDRYHRAGDVRLERAEMDVAGKHDMAGAHARGRRDDPLAHAFGVDRERRGVLEDARPRRFRQFRQPERVVERMDVKCARQMHGVEVVIGLERLADALGRPGLDLGAELSSPLSTLDVLSQPAIGATPGMRASAIVVRTYLRPISESAHSALACSNPTRLISLSMDAAKPGRTKPSLRPDALQAMRRLSNTTTEHPRRAISRAAVSPARPAPITQTSTSRSNVSGPRADASTMVAVYQVGT